MWAGEDGKEQGCYDDDEDDDDVDVDVDRRVRQIDKSHDHQVMNLASVSRERIER